MWSKTFPLPVQFIIAMVAYAINERLPEEVRVLREIYAETTGHKRIPRSSFTRSR